MSQSSSYRAPISSPPDQAKRPLWSVMIPTYNCASYLRATLKSVLDQDPGSDIMQIEVIDDCSTEDDPLAVAKELGEGRVTFYRQSQNVGSLKNFDTCLQRSKGQLVHILHGDDCVREGFYLKMQSAFEQHPEIGAALCRYIYMDEQGHWQSLSDLEKTKSGILNNWLERIASANRIQPPAVVVRREVYEKLGGFDQRICCASEDWEMATRIAAHYPTWYEVEPLALYRVRTSSLTSRCISTGNNVKDYRQAIAIMQEYLPEEKADSITKSALEYNATCALRYVAQSLLIEGNIKLATIQISEALKCSRSWKVLAVLLFILIRSSYVRLNTHRLDQPNS